MVVKTSRGWIVKTADGRTVGGPFSTKSEAQKRDAQIKRSSSGGRKRIAQIKGGRKRSR